MDAEYTGHDPTFTVTAILPMRLPAGRARFMFNT